MECTQRQQYSPDCELILLTKKDTKYTRRQIDVYDRKSAELRRHLASEKAMRELEQRRDRGLTVAYRTSFIR